MVGQAEGAKSLDRAGLGLNGRMCPSGMGPLPARCLAVPAGQREGRLGWQICCFPSAQSRCHPVSITWRLKKCRNSK